MKRAVNAKYANAANQKLPTQTTAVLKGVIAARSRNRPAMKERATTQKTTA